MNKGVALILFIAGILTGCVVFFISHRDITIFIVRLDNILTVSVYYFVLKCFDWLGVSK